MGDTTKTDSAKGYHLPGWIKVNEDDGEPNFIQVSNIVGVRPNGEGCRIFDTSGDEGYWNVDEPMTKVLAKIGFAHAEINDV